MTITDHDIFMFRLAKHRVVVRLDDGRSARLIAWRPRSTKRISRSNRARVEFPSGAQASVLLNCVVAWEDEQGVTHQLPPMSGTP